MFLLAQVLINVRSCRTKVCPKEIQEDVACNKILKPFCMQFSKDEANRVFSDMAGAVRTLETGLPRLAADRDRVRSICAWPCIVSLNLNAH